MSDLVALLESNRCLVADGGMGTSLFAMGLSGGQSPERWNADHADRVAAVHQSFVDAGADIILTNTFGGSRTRLERDKLADRLVELNAAGVRIAREVADRAGHPVVVAGSVGPTGELFEPMGPLTHDSTTEVFVEQISALVAAGADVIWIETLYSTEELAAAVAATESFALPIVTTMSFDTGGKTMMGVAPSDFAEWWQQQNVAATAIGANCGVGPADVVLAATEIHDADPDVVVVAKGNCGLPQIIDGKLWYPTSSDSMSDYAELAIDGGARIIGACCGSIPDHIRQIRRVVDSYIPSGEAITIEVVENRLGVVSGRRYKERRQIEEK